MLVDLAAMKETNVEANEFFNIGLLLIDPTSKKTKVKESLQKYEPTQVRNTHTRKHLRRAGATTRRHGCNMRRNASEVWQWFQSYASKIVFLSLARRGVPKLFSQTNRAAARLYMSVRCRQTIQRPSWQKTLFPMYHSATYPMDLQNGSGHWTAL